MQFPKHLSLSLTHNDHKTSYETVSQTIELNPDYLSDDAWVSVEQKAKAIETDEVWTLHWYPITPVGFCVLHAADLDVLLRAIENITEEEKPDV